MDEIIKHINDTNASFRSISAGDAKNTDLFLDNEHYELFKDAGEKITVRFNKENLSQAILFIASILPRKYDNSSVHKKIQYSTEFVIEQLALLDGFFTIDGKSEKYRTQIWNARKDVPKKNGEIDNRFYFNGLLEDVTYTNPKGEVTSSKFTIRNYLAGGYSYLHIKKFENNIYDVWITNTTEYFNDNSDNNIFYDNNITLQQIYFGAPGTGKSFAIDGIVNKDNSVRTTFHPDSDYSTFVGCYKPVKKIAKSTQKPLLDYNGLVEKFKEYLEVKPTNITKACTLFGYDYHDSIVKMQEDNSHTIPELVAESYKEGSTYDSVLRAGMSVYETSSSHTNNEASEITYEFVPQAFTTAYVNAWKDRSNPYYLIIEEINRGNCAQIFGDIFQLLDRDSSGMSSYKITPDKDLQGYLASELKDCDIDEDIKSGEKMQLPSNLNILATMNTSDQSLFPIDSAFKRRWDWKYIPIDYTDKGHYIACGSVKYKWTEFLEAVNARIESVTQSEDKKMGGWFVKPNGKEITADKFVSKVVFYLWNDVFKDFGHDGNTIFKDDFNKFHKFFDFKGDVKLDVLEKFLVALGLTPLKNTADLTDEDDFEADYDESIAPNQKGYDYSMYSINGDGRYNKGEVAHEAVKMFINNHSNLSANEVVEIWSNLGITVTNLIMSEETYNDKKNKSKEPKPRFERRYNEIKINEDARIYVTKGFTLESITQFIEKVNSQLDWNINIEQI